MKEGMGRKRAEGGQTWMAHLIRKLSCWARAHDQDRVISFEEARTI